MSLVLPGAGDVRDLVNGLLDRGVTVTRESQPVLPGRAVHVVGSYVDDTAEVRAVAMTDHLLGTVLGAALALVPPPRVEQAVNDGLVPPDLAENTREVLNVAASLFNTGEEHLKLQATWVVPEPVTEQVVDFLRIPAQRTDLRVEVPGYGEGVLAILVR
jgi:hypothetical protein